MLASEYGLKLIRNIETTIHYLAIGKIVYLSAFKKMNMEILRVGQLLLRVDFLFWPARRFCVIRYGPHFLKIAQKGKKNSIAPFARRLLKKVY